MTTGDERKDSIGYIFTAPYIIFLLIFTAYPLIFSFYLVFHSWDLITPPEYVGLRNFYFLMHDTDFWQALLNTLVFLAIHIPAQVVFSIMIAMVLAEKIAAKTFFRAAFFLPVIISGAVVTILWQKLYSTDTGVFNQVLGLFGVAPVKWLTSTSLAMPSIAVMATWKNMGFYVVLFLAGLLSIPAHLYEVSKIEGTTRWQDFWHITLPLLRPTMLLVVVLSTFGAFSLFIEPYVMTGGGPLSRTLSTVLYIYKQGFFFYHMGYAATMGVVLTGIILTVVVLQKRFVESNN